MLCVNKPRTQEREIAWEEISTGKVIPIERSSRVLFPNLMPLGLTSCNPRGYRLSVNDPV